MTAAFLEVDNLTVSFPTEDGVVKAVAGSTFSVAKGRTLAIVGESGSGKSVTAQAIMGLLNRNFADISGRIALDGTDLLALDDDQVRELRGSTMAMIFQDPLSSLHPFYRIGDQLAEAVRVHNKVSKSEARARAIDALHRVGIPSPDKRVDDYPHQLSGGMRQRVMIAMALINSPSLLIADEPTTALDVTVQAQITELMSELQRETGTTLIIITHDLGVVADVADEVCVMYGGRVAEYAPVNEVYYRPQHPYTHGLLASVPRLATDRVDRLDPIPGNPPSLINLPSGCVFHPRCSRRSEVPDDRCRLDEPALVSVATDHLVRCHLAEREASGGAR
jgi:peptide/nickel transport system ATP-binding protein